MLVPEPNSVTTKTAAPAAVRPRRLATAAPRRPARLRRRPSRPRGGERSRVRSSSAAIRRPCANLVEQGKAEKNPEVCAKDGPIKSERLVVDPASKGVKNVLVYLPKPTAVNEDAKKAAASAKLDV